MRPAESPVTAAVVADKRVRIRDRQLRPARLLVSFAPKVTLSQ